MQTHTLVWCTFLTLTVWALIQAPGDLQGQTAGTVSGRVLAAESGAGLSAVQVHIPALGLGTLTQNEGRFLILNVPVGTHEIFAERIGYATMSQDIVVQNGQTTTVDLVVEFEALGTRRDHCHRHRGRDAPTGGRERDRRYPARGPVARGVPHP